MKELKTPLEVISALGGCDAVSKLTGMTPHTISEHIRPGGRQRFPSKTYVVMIRALERRGITAPPELWQMVA